MLRYNLSASDHSHVRFLVLSESSACWEATNVVNEDSYSGRQRGKKTAFSSLFVKKRSLNFDWVCTHSASQPEWREVCVSHMLSLDMPQDM